MPWWPTIADNITDLAGWAAVLTAVALLLRNKAETAAALAELKPDHGTSVKDSVNRIEALVREQGTQLEDQAADIKAHGATLDRLGDQLASLDHRLGHEIGDLRHDANIIHEDHASRLRQLEATR